MRAVRSALFSLALLLLSVVAQAQFVIKQSTGCTIALPDIVAAADGKAGLTGQTGTVYLARITRATGAITKAASTNNIVEVDAVNAPGKYILAITSTETSALGFIQGYYKSVNSDPMGFTISVVAFDPDDAVALGLSRVDATISSRSTYAGTDTSGTTTLLTRIPGTIQPQTGDSFARLGAPAGASISADIAAVPAASAAATWAAVSRTLTGVVTLGPNEDTALTRLFGTLNATPAFTAASMALFPNVTVGGYATGMAPKDVLNLAIPNEGGLTLGQAVYGSFLQTLGKFGAPTRAVSSPWTISVPFIRASDGLTVFTYTTTYTDSTFSKTLSRSYTTSSLPTF